MAQTLDITEAAEILDQLIDRTLAGEDIVIARGGMPLVHLVPVPKKAKPRVPGRSKGRIWIAPDFDEISEDELNDWEGR